MSSSNAVAAAGGGGLGWQVDLPGLASLVLNMSAASLKKFAQAGVHTHTILSMGEIAEKCPASTEYRRELSACRREQRKQSEWFYKVVEFGSATNFVADELLKNRAGENVIALMSAILPVMSENSCDNLLLKLFEATAAPLDKTPGLGQLRSLRETLVPLARKTQFKDKVLQYHVLARRLLQSDDHAAMSIPSAETAAQVILALARLAQDPRLILNYRGLKGSGWVIAYARHVLGLSVCVRSSASNSVPISGDYQSARVLVHLHDREGKFEILAQGRVQDFFVTESLNPANCQGWCLDTMGTNLLESYMPKDFSRNAVAVMMRTMVDEYVELIAKEISGSRGTRGYLCYCLPQIRGRAHKILDLLGCEQLKNEGSEQGTWRDFFKGNNYNDPLAGPAWTTSRLGGTIGASTEAVLDQNSERRISFLLKLVDLASWLSFTDWHKNVGHVSTCFLEDDASWRDSLAGGIFLSERSLETTFKEIQRGQNPLGLDARSFVALLCRMVMIFLIGARQRQDLFFVQPDLLAFEHCGIIFAQNAAIRETLDLEACLLHLTCGTIMSVEERRKQIYTLPQAHSQHWFLAHRLQEQTGKYRPTNLFSSISISTHVDISGHDLICEQSAVIGNELYGISDPGRISEALLQLFVTDPCEHDYYDELDKMEHWGPTIDTWLLAVDQNPTGQWLAYQETQHRVNILQRDCCIRCALEVVLGHKTGGFGIIHGRFRGEPLNKHLDPASAQESQIQGEEETEGTMNES